MDYMDRVRQIVYGIKIRKGIFSPRVVDFETEEDNTLDFIKKVFLFSRRHTNRVFSDDKQFEKSWDEFYEDNVIRIMDGILEETKDHYAKNNQIYSIPRNGLGSIIEWDYDISWNRSER